MRVRAVLLGLLLVSSCEVTTEPRGGSFGPPLLDEPWFPPVVHEDSAFDQEISSSVGTLEDVRSIACDAMGTCYVASPQGVYEWTGSTWENLGIAPGRSANWVAVGENGGVATAGPSGATVAGEALELPATQGVRFVAPRRGGGWWLTGSDLAGYWDGAWHPLDQLSDRNVREIADTPDGNWFAATSTGVVTASASFTTSHGLPSDDVRSVAVTGEGIVWAATAAGLARHEAGAWKPLSGSDGLHYGDVSRIRTDEEERLLVSTPMGASVYGPGGYRRYYFGRTWLVDSDVRASARTPDGALWFATAGGVSRVERKPTTLSEKARHIDEIAQERHVRLGYTSTDNHLTTAGDVTSWWNGDDDNDGQWTGMYLASQCFRYAVSGEERARDNAKRAAEALLRLQQVDGLDGFFARSVIPPDQCEARQASGDGEWHLSGDGRWCWKGDTSSDEFVGHVFGLSLFHDLVADDDEKAEVASSMNRLVGGIIDNGYQLLDVDGQVTSHGHFDPDWMHNNLAAQFGDAGLNSAMILGALHAVFRMTGDVRYRKAFDQLARTEGYADYVRRIEEINTAYLVNHDSEEMSFLAMYTLMRYEDDSALMASWREGLEQLWEVQRPERNPEFNFMYAALSRSETYDHEQSVETLQKLSWDLVLWGLDLRHRQDREEHVDEDRHGRPQNTFVFPYDERQVMRWSENPYAYEQRGNGTQESSGIFWLLPYWLGRYHGLIV